MKTAASLLIVICLSLCACDRDTPSKLGGVGEDQGFISAEKTREVAMHVLLNRYPKAEIVSELGEGQTWRYRFATNGVTLPVAVVVDRKAGKAHFEKVSQ